LGDRGFATHLEIRQNFVAWRASLAAPSPSRGYRDFAFTSPRFTSPRFTSPRFTSPPFDQRLRRVR